MRLGAFTAFGGRQTLTVAPGSDQALAVDELPADPEPAEPGRVVESDDYREILSTALFDPGPAGCVVFRHQRYVEYLAAAYLVERGAVREQVAGLVGTGATGVLPAAMIGVVAWLAALEPELVRDAIDRNASVPSHCRHADQTQARVIARSGRRVRHWCVSDATVVLWSRLVTHCCLWLRFHTYAAMGYLT